MDLSRCGPMAKRKTSQPQYNDAAGCVLLVLLGIVAYSVCGSVYSALAQLYYYKRIDAWDYQQLMMLAAFVMLTATLVLRHRRIRRS